MRVIFATDLHGIRRQYEELFHLAEIEKADAVILGGDLLPIDGPFERLVPDQLSFVRDFLSPTFDAFCRRHSRTGIYWIFGNNDLPCSVELLQEKTRGLPVRALHNRAHSLGEHATLIGYAHVPPTPFRIKDHERLDFPGEGFAPAPKGGFVCKGDRMVQVDQEEHFQSLPAVASELEQLPAAPPDRQLVYVIHAPPHDTVLDRMYGGYPAGSRAVRKFIEKRQPYLNLHGHIHEAPEVGGHFQTQLGRTVCINPGHSTEKLDAVIFELEDVMGTLRHTTMH